LLCLSKQITKVTSHSEKRYQWVRGGMPSTVIIDNRHNHATVNADALSLRKIDPQTRDKFYAYFEQGMSAAAASDYHTNQLEMDSDVFDSSAIARADAAVNPKLSTVSYWYGLWREANLGRRHGEGMWSVLEAKIAEYQASGACVSITREPFTVAILTPIMQRAHQLPTAEEIAFADSTASCDADNHVITFILVLSPHGAVPAGVIITAGQSQQDYVAGFSALNQLLNSRGFHGKGHPNVIITDDSAAERTALSTVWPASLLLLCHFHVMQALWRWLWDTKHNIAKEDRKPLMQSFRAVLYSPDKIEAAELFNDLVQLADLYENFQQHVQTLWERRAEWCLAWRNVPQIRGHHTNNYAEITVRLFKDNVLTRCKAYNAVAIIDFIVTVMERFYRNRLERFANGRVTMHHLLLEKLSARSAYIKGQQDIEVVTSSSETSYLVPSEADRGVIYEVDATVGVCTCPAGMSGQCCKHQVAVYKWFGEALPNIPPVTDTDRYSAACLALGDCVPVREFYSSRTVTGTTLDTTSAADQTQTQQTPNTDHQFDSVTELSDSATSSACQTSAKLIDRWTAVASKVQQLIALHSASSNENDILAAMRKLEQRLDNVHTGSQLTTLMHSFGHLIPRRNHAGASIHTQPTAAGRRKQPGITRGSKRQLAGRPAKERSRQSMAKRPRNLACNIDLGVRHAKSHGQGH